MKELVRILISLLFVACISCTSSSEDEAVSSQATNPVFEGKRDSSVMTSRIVNDRIATLVQSDRFIKLQTILNEKFAVFPDLSKVEGRISPKGDFLSITLIDSGNGSDSGYIVISEKVWAIGIARTDSLPEGYLVEGDDTADALSLNRIPIELDEHDMGVTDSEGQTSDAVGTSAQALSSWTCSYASSMGLNIACIILDENPLGYYYKRTTRAGYGDLSRPQWWSCVWGNIHICPQYEYSTSPIVSFNCGYPPSHSAG